MSRAPAPAERLKQGGQSQGASLRPARLGGVAGQGTLQILRDGAGAAVSIEGTWRPDADQAQIGRLLSAADESATVRFEGPIDDTTRSEPEPVEVEVKITSHGAYDYGAGSDEGDVGNGERRHIFNFEPVEADAIATS